MNILRLLQLDFLPRSVDAACSSCAFGSAFHCCSSMAGRNSPAFRNCPASFLTRSVLVPPRVLRWRFLERWYARSSSRSDFLRASPRRCWRSPWRRHFSRCTKGHFPGRPAANSPSSIWPGGSHCSSAARALFARRKTHSNAERGARNAESRNRIATPIERGAPSAEGIGKEKVRKATSTSVAAPITEYAFFSCGSALRRQQLKRSIYS
jgi:hypothetical protein